MKKFIALIALLPFSAFADYNYTVFDPVPDDQLRSMSTERPSKTDSVNTVDAGHFQIETSLLNEVDQPNAKEYDLGATTNIRLGLAYHWDVQVITNLYQDLQSQHEGGFGDTTVRLKYCFWGDRDGAPTSLAIIPYIVLPTSKDNIADPHYEEGTALVFGANLPDGWSVTEETTVGHVHSQNTPSYADSFAQSGAVYKTLTPKTTVYGELAMNMDPITNVQVSNDYGIVYSITDNWHVDTGINIGLNAATPKANWFIGTAYRF